MKALAYLLLLVGVPAMAQELGNNERSRIIDSNSQKLKTLYVYPEVAEQMSKQLYANAAKGQYAKINDPNAFAERLTADLLAVCQDKHLGVHYDPRPVDKHPVQEDNYELAKSRNFGLKELKILDGTA
jgi:hypothetical protein